jgi:hypothetical protein
MKIDTDIPIPGTTQRGGNKPATYPFGDLPIGGSFAVAPEGAAKVGTAAVKWKSRHAGWNYRTKKSPHEFRLWRIS